MGNWRSAPPVFRLKGSMDEKPEFLANKIGRFLGVNHNDIVKLKPGYATLNFWKRLLESKGVLVFQSSGVPLEIMRGACIAREVLPVIIINSNDTENGRIFSLFHELVHVALREDGISNFRYSERDRYDQVEVFCNQTAAEILVPSQHLLESLIVQTHLPGDYSWTNEELQKLSCRFCVSQEVILRRLLSLGKTTVEFYRGFRNNLAYEVKKKQSGGNYYRNNIAKNGQLFLSLVLQGYYQEIISATTFSDYTQIKASNLSKLEKFLYAAV